LKLSISYPLGLAILEIFAEAQQLGRGRLHPDVTPENGFRVFGDHRLEPYWREGEAPRPVKLHVNVAPVGRPLPAFCSCGRAASSWDWRAKHCADCRRAA
jgi:hypothetical protein